jgi:hypothetical protein
MILRFREFARVLIVQRKPHNGHRELGYLTQENCCVFEQLPTNFVPFRV